MVGPAGVDHVGGAEFVGELQLVIVYVYRDDAAGAEEPGALDHVETDATTPEHRDRHAYLGGRVVDHGPHACRDGAADEGGDLSGHAVGNRVAGLLRYHHRVSEYAELGHLIDVVVAVVEPDSAVKLPPASGHVRVAEVWKPCTTRLAVTAVGHEGQNTAVAGFDPRYTRADLHDRTRPLVSQHRGQQGRDCRAADDMVIAGANARRVRLDANLSSLGRILCQLSDFQVPVAFVQYGCFHG